MIPKMGKMVHTSIPTFIPNCSGARPNRSANVLADTASVITPKSWGAKAAPKSPPAAISAKAVTPALGIFSSIRISVPGHSIEVKRPVRTQAMNAGTAWKERLAMR